MLDQSILKFLQELKISARLPKGIVVLEPYSQPETIELCRQFYQRYYHDQQPRVLLLGINPGRFGSGTTGISFTDPIKLESVCGVPNELPKKAELSADFIYEMIRAFGGPGKFYSKFFISAMSPLGFTQDGKNINYYDLPALQKAVTPFIVQSIQQLVDMGMSRTACYCIGEGKNLKVLNELNAKYKWFKTVVPLPHPRFIMQYRRKKIAEFVNLYLEALQRA